MSEVKKDVQNSVRNDSNNSITTSSAVQIVNKRRGRPKKIINSTDSKKSNNKTKEHQVVLKFSDNLYTVLEEIAVAFYKAGATKKPTISSMLYWDVERIAGDVLEKKRIQIIRDLEKEIKDKAQREYQERIKNLGISMPQATAKNNNNIEKVIS